MRVNNEDLLEIDGVRNTVSLGANAVLKPIWLGHICNYAIQMTFTGTPNGTFKLQASNDQGRPNASSEAEQSAAVTTWTDISGSAQPISAAGDHMYQVENAGYTWVRVVYTYNSGTGTITAARCNVKGV